MSRIATDPSVRLNAQFTETATDPIDVRAAVIRHPGDVGRMLSIFGDGLCQFRSILVDAGDTRLSEGDIASLARAATLGIRIILAAPRPVIGFPPLMVLHESDFRQALIASIYAMQRGEKLLALSNMAPDSAILRGMVHHAMRWRASWREPEEGDFLANPA
jgi:hypothetical protein